MPVTAREMEERGVVNRVVATDQDVVEEALRVAHIIAARSAPALRLAKHVVKTGEDVEHSVQDLQLTGTSRNHHVGGGAGD